MHDEYGAWQMIFGVNTIPEYRKKGAPEHSQSMLSVKRKSRAVTVLFLRVKKN